MRVLFIAGEFPPMQGGVGDCTNEIAKALVKLGVEAHVLTTADSLGPASTGRRPESANGEYGVSVHRLVSKWNWSSLRLIGKTIRELAPSIVHIQYQTGAYGMHPAINFLPRYLYPRPGDIGRAPRHGVVPRPCAITTFHDLKLPYLFPKAGPVRAGVTRLLARSSDAVIATNEDDYRRLQSWGVACPALIPIGSNIPTAPPPGFQRAGWRERLGVSEDVTLLCYFGFLNESKGGETLIRALAQVPGAKLLMIGGQVGASDPTNVTYLSHVRDLIAGLALTSRVMWTDYTPASEVTANLLASDICVLPYRDGASYRRGSFMAALAHGLPIVSTLPPPHPAYTASSRFDTAMRGESGRGAQMPGLLDGHNVLLVPPDDPPALARAISRVAALPELRMGLSRGALELAAHFTWEKIAQSHLELYKLLTRSGPQVKGPGSQAT